MLVKITHVAPNSTAHKGLQTLCLGLVSEPSRTCHQVLKVPFGDYSLVTAAGGEVLGNLLLVLSFWVSLALPLVPVDVLIAAGVFSWDCGGWPRLLSDFPFGLSVLAQRKFPFSFYASFWAQFSLRLFQCDFGLSSRVPFLSFA